MSVPVVLPQAHLEQLVSRICMTRKITRQDQHLLMTLSNQSGLGEQQLRLLDSVYERLYKGCIRVVD